MTSAIYRENGKAYVAFSLSDYYDISSLTATFTCGTLNIDIPILKTNVGFKEALEPTEFVLVFPKLSTPVSRVFAFHIFLKAVKVRQSELLPSSRSPKARFSDWKERSSRPHLFQSSYKVLKSATKQSRVA